MRRSGARKLYYHGGRRRRKAKRGRENRDMGGRKRRVALEAAVESRASGTAFLATHHRSRQTVMRSNARPAQRNARVGGQIKELISLIERRVSRGGTPAPPFSSPSSLRGIPRSRIFGASPPSLSPPKWPPNPHNCAHSCWILCASSWKLTTRLEEGRGAALEIAFGTRGKEEE